jgi:F-type H+-transporting ATPase subunit epsilon
MSLFNLSIVTPEKVFYKAPIESLVVPGTEGYLGVLANHAPLMTALMPGKIEFTDAEEKIHTLAVSGGFLEVSKNEATLLADAVERVSEIDIDRAQRAFDRERQRLISAGENLLAKDITSIRAAVARAKNRIKVYKEAH